jgi:hypothetical protein
MPVAGSTSPIFFPHQEQTSMRFTALREGSAFIVWSGETLRRWEVDRTAQGVIGVASSLSHCTLAHSVA